MSKTGIPSIAAVERQIEQRLQEVIELCGARPDRQMLRYLTECALAELKKPSTPQQ